MLLFVLRAPRCTDPSSISIQAQQIPDIGPLRQSEIFLHLPDHINNPIVTVLRNEIEAWAVRIVREGLANVIHLRMADAYMI